MRKTITSLDNVRISYDLSNSFDSTNSLVFLHGLGGDLTALDPLRSLFHQRGYSTLAIDIRGQGESGRPNKRGDYSLEKLAQDVIQVITEEKVTKGVLIGHCFGGMVALQATQDLDDVLSKLVLIDTSYQSPWFGRLIGKLPGIRTSIYFLSRILPNIHLKTKVNYSQFIGGSDYSIPRITSDILHTSIRSYLLLTITVMETQIKEIVKKISLPTLIIEGRLDHIYPPKVAEVLHSLIPQSKLSYIEKGNHIVVLSNVEEVFEKIDSFLKED